MIENIKNIVSKSAPLLGSLVGGPVGGKVVSMLSEVFNSEEKDLSNVIANDPEAALKLKQIESEHKEELISLKIEESKLYVLDVQNARSREIQIVNATGSSDKNLTGLAWLTTLGFFITVFLLFFTSVEYNEILYLLLGTLGAGWTSVMGYFFGSSKGSKDKTNAMIGNK